MATNKTLSAFFRSKEYKNAHETAKDILKVQLEAISENIQPSDTLSIYQLSTLVDLTYRLKDELATTGLIYKNGNVCHPSPLLVQISTYNAQIVRLLQEIGGTTKARKRLNSKDLATAESSNLEKLLQAQQTDDYSDIDSDY